MIRNLSSATFVAIFCLAALPGAANAAMGPDHHLLDGKASVPQPLREAPVRPLGPDREDAARAQGSLRQAKPAILVEPVIGGDG